MKVIFDATSKSTDINCETEYDIRHKTRKLECENCHSISEYNMEDDVVIGAFGCSYIECPICHNRVLVEEIDSRAALLYDFDLTKDNVTFPNHFADNKDAKHIPDDVITNYIREGIKWLEIHKEEGYYICETGDMFIFIGINDNDNTYHVVVSKNYFETDIIRLKSNRK